MGYIISIRWFFHRFKLPLSKTIQTTAVPSHIRQAPVDHLFIKCPLFICLRAHLVSFKIFYILFKHIFHPVCNFKRLNNTYSTRFIWDVMHISGKQNILYSWIIRRILILQSLCGGMQTLCMYALIQRYSLLKRYFNNKRLIEQRCSFCFA